MLGAIDENNKLIENREESMSAQGVDNYLKSLGTNTGTSIKSKYPNLNLGGD
jgi:hypothetical protein